MSAAVRAVQRKSIAPALVVLAIGAVLPLVLTSGFQLRLAMLISIYAILSMGFNLIYGYTGQISLGQQAFYAIGAYAFSMLMIKLQWPPVPAVAASLALCAGLALLIGIPLLRLRTHYLAMATLAFGLIFYGVAIRWIDFTGGSTGLSVPPIMVGNAAIGRTGTYYLVLAFAGLMLLLHDFIIRSHVGRAMQAIRDDDTAAAALGVHVTRYKLRIFVLAAVMAAMAGICFSFVSLRVDLSMSEFRVLVAILTIAVVGGLGTRFGPIIGSIFVVLLPQLLVRFGELETLVYGAFILLFLLFMPHGLAGFLESGAWRRFFRKRVAQRDRAGA
jgi:branched-chain amino acid transport system permease protein